MSSYFTKLMRIPSHNFDPPREKQRSRSLDVEALERSGIKMLRVVMTIKSADPWPGNHLQWPFFCVLEGSSTASAAARRAKWVQDNLLRLLSRLNSQSTNFSWSRQRHLWADRNESPQCLGISNTFLLRFIALITQVIRVFCLKLESSFNELDLSYRFRLQEPQKVCKPSANRQ